MTLSCRILGHKYRTNTTTKYGCMRCYPVMADARAYPWQPNDLLKKLAVSNPQPGAHGPLDKLRQIDPDIRKVIINKEPRGYNGWIIGLSFADGKTCEIAIDHQQDADMMKLAVHSIKEYVKRRKSKLTTEESHQNNSSPCQARMSRWAWLRQEHPTLYEWSMNDATVHEYLHQYTNNVKSFDETLVLLVGQLASEKQSNLSMAIQAATLQTLPPIYYGADIITPLPSHRSAEELSEISRLISSRMTGQEWYDKFAKELHLETGQQLATVNDVLDAAKKAAGIK